MSLASPSSFDKKDSTLSSNDPTSPKGSKSSCQEWGEAYCYPLVCTMQQRYSSNCDIPKENWNQPYLRGEKNPPNYNRDSTITG
jgi:hypothetical protein